MLLIILELLSVREKVFRDNVTLFLQLAHHRRFLSISVSSSDMHKLILKRSSSLLKLVVEELVFRQMK